MPIDFNIRPRHVQMFGKQGILAPLYQRQATQTALAEEERRSQSRFEQMKALTELRSKLERPLKQAQIEQARSGQNLREFQLEQLQAGAGYEQAERTAVTDFSQRYAAEPTQEGKDRIAREEYIRRGYIPGEQQQGQQVRPPTSTFIGDPETGLPLRDEQGKLISVPGTMKYPPKGGGSQVSRLNLADRTLKTMRARYNRDSKPSVRFDYSDIDWDSRPMKSLGVERAGVFGMGGGIVGGGRIGWMDNIMSVMATPATVADSTGQIVPDRTEYSRRANIIENFRAELEDEPKSSSKEKMKQLLHDMERAFNESVQLSSEEGQTYLSQPTQMMPQQRIVGEEVSESPYGTWTGP